MQIQLFLNKSHPKSNFTCIFTCMLKYSLSSKTGSFLEIQMRTYYHSKLIANSINLQNSIVNAITSNPSSLNVFYVSIRLDLILVLRFCDVLVVWLDDFKFFEVGIFYFNKKNLEILNNFSVWAIFFQRKGDDQGLHHCSLDLERIFKIAKFEKAFKIFHSNYFLTAHPHVFFFFTYS